jgi:hypothetical protein
MIASKEKHPDLKRGTYYSMPEWFVLSIQELLTLFADNILGLILLSHSMDSESGPAV